MTGYLSLKEAAERLGLIHTATLRHAIRNGRLTGVKMGRDWFVNERDLEVFAPQVKPRGPRKTKEPQP